MQWGIGMFIAPFGDFILDKLIAPFNMLILSTLLFGVRCFLYATVSLTPPSQLVFLTLFDLINATLFWIACMKFSFKIVPHDCYATVVVVMSMVDFSLGEKNTREIRQKNMDSKAANFLLFVLFLQGLDWVVSYGVS